jgi:hypothetical protein
LQPSQPIHCSPSPTLISESEDLQAAHIRSGCSGTGGLVGRARSSAVGGRTCVPPKGTDCARKEAEEAPLDGGCKKDVEKEWRRLWELAGCVSPKRGTGLWPSTSMGTGCSAGRLRGDCSWSAPAEVLAVDALFGLGVDRFLLLVDGVLRGRRGLPLGQPWCFFGLEPSAGAASCPSACDKPPTVSSGGV